MQQLTLIAEQLGIMQAHRALAWTLQSPNVAAAIVGPPGPSRSATAPRPAGSRIDPDGMRRIDTLLGPVVERDLVKVDSAE